MTLRDPRALEALTSILEAHRAYLEALHVLLRVREVKDIGVDGMLRSLAKRGTDDARTLRSVQTDAGERPERPER